MKRAILVPSITITTLVILLLPDALFADPRAQTINFRCGNILEHNTTIFASNFVANMENISDQVRTSGFGIAVTGSGPDANYGLAQCFGDLSLVDCVLCSSQARSVLPQCYPWTSGTIYLDGCFMRSDNYSFFEEYTGPNDHIVCGNITRDNSAFQESARQAISEAVSAAPNNNGYARARVAVSGTANESAYVLANCWRTLSASSCRACLENASASMLGCLPSSEGRALNTGCFMRYSNIDFLNPIPRNGNSRGRVMVIGLAVASAASVLIIGAVIGVYIWRQRIIQKKRKGSSDVKKLVKTLHDSSLNFKYATLEKATGSFDEANKLGHGGFGAVYKGVLQDGREIAVKRLFFNNKNRAGDFYNEVNIISSVDHKNLVRLLGGYMAPEYLAHGQLTEKADVYSFGVLLLEIVTGRENNRSKTTEYSDSLVTTAWKHFQRRTVEELFDPNLMLHNYHNINIKNEILRVVHIGLLCTQESPSLRPFMSKALEMLVNGEQLPEPTRPPFIDENTMELYDTSENTLSPLEHENVASVAGISHSIFFPR
ncbi:hypothetical protein BUALT_Bualt05G0160300 [Buddleja alternifolia]|uniref:Cysteine-rich receptor-like protein kinase 2 n=1 Tax=Buddleja alternifolia TaxID=168488 RepID=A0AAV6XW25_9LAMI|nr:hypothetical protein BUALT_Bualt05G0160300 [Buddleja alternifolia]